MKSRRKTAFILLPILLVAAIVYAFLPKPVQVETAPIIRGPLQVTVRDDGRTRIKDRYILSAPLAGQLQRVLLKPGHDIKTGDRIATINPTAPELLNPRDLAAAEARVRAAEEARRQAQAIFERTDANHEYAQTDLIRVRELFEADTVSSQELDRAQLAARTTEGDLNSARFGVRIAAYELELAQTALLRTQPDPGGEAGEILLGAPITGKVLRVMQESAAVVAPGAPLMELGDPRNLEIEVDVLSSDAVRIQPGARVILEYWGGPRPLEARVRLVEPAGFLKISALGVEEQRVWVIADFTSPPAEWQNLGDAYRVEARIVVWESADALRVPVGALFRQEDDWAVFLVQDNRARLRTVQIGQRGEDHAEVVAGLATGDQVILHSGDRIRDGAKVTGRR